MELFSRAKAVRLRSHHDKYLLADEDEEHVCQERDAASPRARWTVEFVEEAPHVIRLKSCYGRYLTASNEPYLLGVTGRKVLQTVPRRLDSSLEWEPLRDGVQVRLKTRYGQYLRANGGLPPWRNSITHDIPHRTATQDWILWDVDVVEIRVQSPAHSLSSLTTQSSDASSPKLESSSSFGCSPPKTDGRTIHYTIVDDNANLDESVVGPSFNFKGTSVDELTHKLEEEIGFSDIIVCSRNPLNGKLFPLLLHLPPNNVTMHVVVVPASSKVAKSLKMPGHTS